MTQFCLFSKFINSSFNLISKLFVLRSMSTFEDHLIKIDHFKSVHVDINQLINHNSNLNDVEIFEQILQG